MWMTQRFDLEEDGLSMPPESLFHVELCPHVAAQKPFDVVAKSRGLWFHMSIGSLFK